LETLILQFLLAGIILKFSLLPNAHFLSLKINPIVSDYFLMILSLAGCLWGFFGGGGSGAVFVWVFLFWEE
jgi:hypothetical protein